MFAIIRVLCSEFIGSLPCCGWTQFWIEAATTAMPFPGARTSESMSTDLSPSRYLIPARPRTSTENPSLLSTKLGLGFENILEVYNDRRDRWVGKQRWEFSRREYSVGAKGRTNERPRLTSRRRRIRRLAPRPRTLLIDWPLEAEGVTVGVTEIHLGHAIGGDFGFLDGRSLTVQFCVRCVNVGTGEIKTGVLVGCGASGISFSRAFFVELVGRVQHDFRAALP